MMAARICADGHRRHPTKLRCRLRLSFALLLALAAAVSLGITRFALRLSCCRRRCGLTWAGATPAGSMNTANTFGYFVGALIAPMMRRWDAARVLLSGAALATLFMAASGFFVDSNMAAGTTRAGGRGERAGVRLRRCNGGEAGGMLAPAAAALVQSKAVCCSASTTAARVWHPCCPR